ncbi:hypothetical protein EOD39_8317 [Acipenser ruthenus]|uniref:Uncharacterized protein n=1 Tax=Acipenser ruthenus TaxID=7906 RepID=A0A662YW68_ACIRT|nr:hypothetical protein EOD39_8317 [Acipenser ruthenus]
MRGQAKSETTYKLKRSAPNEEAVHKIEQSQRSTSKKKVNAGGENGELEKQPGSACLVEEYEQDSSDEEARWEEEVLLRNDFSMWSVKLNEDILWNKEALTSVLNELPALLCC